MMLLLTFRGSGVEDNILHGPSITQLTILCHHPVFSPLETQTTLDQNTRQNIHLPPNIQLQEIASGTYDWELNYLETLGKWAD